MSKRRGVDEWAVKQILTDFRKTKPKPVWIPYVNHKLDQALEDTCE